MHALVGIRYELEDGFSWSLLQQPKISVDISLFDTRVLPVGCNPELAVASSILAECFGPVIDARSGRNMIRDVVYGCG